MSTDVIRVYMGKKYLFPWGIEKGTFSQLIDGSKAAWCKDEDAYYWFYYDTEDRDLLMPVSIIKMSENEQDELEFQDIISDLMNASHRGLYPEVTQEIRQILIGRSVRREVIFALNAMNPDLIKNHKGIVYLVSRKVLELLEKDMELRSAIGLAINHYMNHRMATIME